jgi:hypothetical protein
MSVDVTVLYFTGCPSWQTALERVHAFTGSPTIWLDGTDPFESAAAAPALACRVYPTPVGLAGSPTVDQLADVLGRHHV